MPIFAREKSLPRLRVTAGMLPYDMKTPCPFVGFIWQISYKNFPHLLRLREAIIYYMRLIGHFP